jgi:hypothetical protein
VLTADPFGLTIRGDGAAIGEGGVQRAQVNTRVGHVSVNDCLIIGVFAESEVCLEQPAVDLGEGAGLIATHPLGSDQRPPAVRDSRRPTRVTVTLS